jgi:hypothetical protein
MFDEYQLGLYEGKKNEQERIKEHITARIEELRSCNKSDDCVKIADYIESYLPEWILK